MAGFRQEIVGPAPNDGSTVLIHGARRQSDDDRFFSPGIRLYSSGRLQPVHDRHMHIHQDQLWASIPPSFGWPPRRYPRLARRNQWTSAACISQSRFSDDRRRPGFWGLPAPARRRNDAAGSTPFDWLLPASPCSIGISNRNIDPLPGVLVTVISPPIRRAYLRLMASPKPVPSWRVQAAASLAKRFEQLLLVPLPKYPNRCPQPGLTAIADRYSFVPK